MFIARDGGREGGREKGEGTRPNHIKINKKLVVVREAMRVCVYISLHFSSFFFLLSSLLHFSSFHFISTFNQFIIIIIIISILPLPSLFNFIPCLLININSLSFYSLIYFINLHLHLHLSPPSPNSHTR